LKYYDSMGFESEHGIWVRRVDAAQLAAESEARHQSCVVLMNSVQDHRARIRELEADVTELRRLRTALTWIRDARKHPSRTTDMTRNDMRELAGEALQGELE
jgi:hypothetical protein